MKRIITTVAAVLATGGGITFAAPAGAQPPCDDGNFCIFHDKGGGGSHYSLDQGIGDLGGVAGGLNDHVFSVWNRDDRNWCLYADADHGNQLLLVTRGPLIDLEERVAFQVSSVEPC
ncbi:peptidase inhibitor family I36 protein [Nocardia abscessus]|uniref:peptidase inhibitor family I36 protein n=1 Tax=Nocardia abscessus TaxID=120957 RepID=UPI0002DA17F7|nr:peptidase inhibitor family I36 protein [Nocardia abscessus]MCC3330919.1 peptidase inhibitor family I36 protein [Nocardia abscessus]